jgi:hypothetical protein
VVERDGESGLRLAALADVDLGDLSIFRSRPGDTSYAGARFIGKQASMLPPWRSANCTQDSEDGQREQPGHFEQRMQAGSVRRPGLSRKRNLLRELSWSSNDG